MISTPRLYAILDTSCFADSEDLLRAAEELLAAGVTLLQYRNKSDDVRVILTQAGELCQRSRAGAPFDCAQGTSAPHKAKLIMNDRADLCLAAEFDGVHVGQDDLSPESARRVIGPNRWLGVSTHNPEQVIEADRTSADYIAIGPVFATGTKANPDPVIGLDGL